MLVDDLESAAEQLPRFAVDLADRVFQRADRFVQVGRLRIEEGLAFAGSRELVERCQIDRAESSHFTMQAVDFTLQSGNTHLVGFDRQRDGFEIGFGIGQQLLILLGAQARSLLL